MPPVLEDFRRRFSNFRNNQMLSHGDTLLMELLMETIADLSAKLDAIKTAIEALKNAPPPVATQADLDALGAKADAIQADLPPAA